jgi:hypothetical protein
VSARRHQVLVLKDDGLPAGTISKWEWNAAVDLTACSYYEYRLRLCHTTLSALTDTFANNYAGNTPVTVYSRNPATIGAVSANSWFGFPFDTPFDYDGQRNLVVEVWWVNDNNGGGNTQWNFPVNGRCCFSYIVNGNPINGYPDKGFASYFLHYMRATISPSAVAPTSLGRVKSMYH